MTPKEKALELINKFLRYTPADEELEYPFAKQCALIAVDEIIKKHDWDEHSDYWQEVKTEIEKI